MCDDKSGYDHIKLHPTSRTYFGFQWGGWFFLSKCIPFGWKSSTYIYHTTGLVASHRLRSWKIPSSLYIDDQHNGQLSFPGVNSPSAYQTLASGDEANFVTSLGRSRPLLLRISSSHAIHGVARATSCISSARTESKLNKITKEQLRAHITPKQAVPLFLSKLLLLARFMNRKIAERSVNPSGLFVLVRDRAFFKALFFSGDCGSDLGMVRTGEILRFPQGDGLLFNHVWGKTLWDGASNVFGIRRHPNPELCPVKAIETYVAVASELRVSVTNGYLFRPTNL